MMRDKLTLSFLVLLFCASAIGSRIQTSSNDVQSRAFSAADGGTDGICSEIVKVQDYPCQEHKVKTQDGYILSIQNIPHGRSGKSAGERPPVLLQHGLSLDAISWLLSPPDQSLALLLADNGFDVWLVSTRGTNYSLGHLSLTPDDAPYWDWSWDEVAAYDLPATVQYVHDQTRQKLHYVGHSMGTLIALAALSKGQLVNMLRSAAMLSPIAYVSHMTSPIATHGAKILLHQISKWLNIPEFNPKSPAVIGLLLYICSQKGVKCELASFTGPNCCLNSSIIPVFLDHEPQSTSSKNMIHFAQRMNQRIYLCIVTRGNNISMYDYGDEKENRKHYGQPAPPLYNMSNIPKHIPLFFAYGGADALAVSADVKILLHDLKDHQGDKLVVHYQKDYAHADFILAVNARQTIYNPLMAFFKLQ